LMLVQQCLRDFSYFCGVTGMVEARFCDLALEEVSHSWGWDEAMDSISLIRFPLRHEAFSASARVPRQK
ncbi:hypothetical protein HAX54_022514, partial [Datura stramonium]|nr:hypothetical protein [Datura stramonium]